MATYEKVSWCQRLKNNMKDLSGKEKLAYLWEYYKWFAIGAVALIVATVSIIISVRENSKEVLYSGVVANIAASEEGKAYLSEGWFEVTVLFDVAFETDSLNEISGLIFSFDNEGCATPNSYSIFYLDNIFLS